MKISLRKYAAERRNSLSFEDAARKSLEISGKLFALEDFSESKSILFYASFNKEVNTQDSIKKALALNKKVVLPLLVNRGDKNLILSRISQFPQDLEIGPFGIMQPKRDKLKITSLDEIDLVITPGVGFDIKGNRLGYGGGYYDRLLANKSDKTKLIALAYEAQILDEIPAEAYDIRMDKIITEQRIITINL